MTTFGKYIRVLLERAGREAALDHATAIEAQHVLLAIAAEPETPANRVLLAAGLDRPALRSALAREFEHSLGVAGVALGAFDLPPPSSEPEHVTRMGASVRQALERGTAGVRKGLRPAHVLLGILQAEVGTVPRALALAGVDRRDLIERVRQTADIEA
jgi:ATP-dependent Clp protease ATP-binding subunit ClpA